MDSRRKIIITNADRQKLGSLVESTEILDVVQRRYIEDLSEELERATAVEPQDVPPDVITMNSTVRLRDVDSGETLEYTLVYPEDADVQKNRISVLAPVGTAIIGYRKGDTIEWAVPKGRIRLKVEEVLFQPEDAGRFDL
jgi:regulator of nucleoside diphosphate kinase